MEVLTEANFQESVQKAPLVLVDFWASWCRPCVMLAPVLEKLAPNWRASYSPRSIPTRTSHLLRSIRSTPSRP